MLTLIKNKTLFLNDVPQKTYIYPPTVQEVFEIETKQQEKIDALPYVYSKPEEEKGNLFRGLALKVKGAADVRLAYKKIRQLFPESDHVSLAYVLKHSQKGWQDDAEHGAGKRILQMLEHKKLANTAIFVTRKTTGNHLGLRRFMYIEKVAEDALDKLTTLL